MFVIANVKQAILGADFLQHFGLVVDIGRRTLSDSTTHLRVDGLLFDPPGASPGLSQVQQDPSNPYLSLLSEFPALTQACAADRPIKHDIVHHIETTGRPVSTRTRRLAPERLRIAREEFEHILELGIIRPSSSSWSSALHMVPKRTPGDLETMWGFPCSEQSHHPGSVPCSPLAGFYHLVAGSHDLHPYRFGPGLPPDSSGTGGCSKNCNHQTEGATKPDVERAGVYTIGHYTRTVNSL